ncbi:MAG TPA: bifunctional DNA-binding transcriptional regulator/O6-methylguanine-DNA methyltransferase Ada [Methyloceanibacter sp.]|nr:bifunctional DNA-binding transcriptional regulator/O6-methylguanine-DNA methyltransferase Ada [Methyloceanibacter sp.]
MPQTASPASRSPAPEPEAVRWEAVLARDGDFDGDFYYSVATTSVYCRPSCPARRPKRANVRFHDTAALAEAAGFRPCKRCKPDQLSATAQHGSKVVQACRLIEAAEAPPSLQALADAAGLSPSHFHRLFKRATGVTPRAYACAKRDARVRAGLGKSATVTQAIYDAGFNSSGRFYAISPDVLGMTPGAFRAGGADERLRCAVSACSLGFVLVATSDKGVCAILLGDTPAALIEDLGRQFPRAEIVDGGKDFADLATKVIEFVETPGAGLDLPLDIRGTAFQHRVWEALRRIPAGTTASYADIAKAIGALKSVRAVAGACAANKLAMAIPCHRVVRSDGGLSGYRWGPMRKRALLDREKSGR